MTDNTHGTRTTKDHFTVEVDDYDLFDLIADTEAVVETDEFVATIQTDRKDPQLRQRMGRVILRQLREAGERLSP